MICKFFQPSQPLQAYVKEYLVVHFQFAGLDIDAVRTYTPCPEQCLTFDPRGRITAVNRQTGKTERRGYAYLSGQQTTSYELHFDPDYLMIKVVFQPGALFKLLGIPLNEFNGYVDAESVLNDEIRSVNEQLANAEDYKNMLEIVERYLLHKSRQIKDHNSPIDHLQHILDLHTGQFSLKWFASQACLSPRQFERKFSERIGISPKLYYRINRFSKAFELKEKNPALSWLDIAIDCGYADFQHLNKDFKQFSGTTPTILLSDYANRTEKILNLV